MPFTLEITDSQVTLMIDFYVERHKDIRKRISELENEAREVTKVIQRLKTKPADDMSMKDVFTNDDYSIKWPWIKKIIFALDKLGKPSTTKEIVDVLSDYEPNFIIDRKRVIASISSTLSVKSGNMFEDKDFVKQDGVTGEYEYYLNVKNTNSENSQSTSEAVAQDEPMDDLPF